MNVLETMRPAPGLRVLLTAAASGIGAAVARAFLQAGARVYVCDIDRAALDCLASEQPGIRTSHADASMPADVDRVFDDVLGAFNGLDVLINNAGIAGPTGPIQDIAQDEWERTVSLNLNSQFYFARRAVPLLIESKSHPCIVAMSSVAGRLGYPYRTPYAASKWAVEGLVRSLAMELGPQGVRVNAILPGAVEGDRMNRMIEARAAATQVSVEEMRDQFVARISLRRFVTADDVAAMALFLCSPAARNVTGQSISVDGNMEYL